MPSLVGVLVLLSVIVESTADSNFVPYFGLFMALWSTFYYEYWKRYNSTLALEWGMSSFVYEDVERPEFEGEWIQSPVDGSRTRYFSPQQRFRRIMGSLVSLLASQCLVSSVV
jgi:hypothetical protein